MPQDMMLGETAIQAASIDIILAGLNQVQLHAVTNPAPVVQILAPRKSLYHSKYHILLTSNLSWIWENPYSHSSSSISSS